MSKLQLRSIFVSDVHLGTRDAQSEYLLDFLRNTDADYIYLLGDIIDLWKLKSGWHWPQINNNLVQLLIHKAARGSRVVYVPGNHDELLRDYAGTNFNGIEIVLDTIHETTDGRRLLLIHGDEFDSVVMNNKWLAHVGSWAYDVLLWLNRHFNTFRRKLGFPYWSLSAFLKHQVKNAVSYISSFEHAVARAAAERGVDGLVCGHIHRATIEEIDGVLYANSGDWVESCTAVAEYPDGSLRVIEWIKESAALLAAAEQLEMPLEAPVYSGEEAA
jgi:UDP-2,3-diacylglucosamine pyrophosphatase LpxH